MAQNVLPRDYIQPGPHNAKLLYLQERHRSEAIWNDEVHISSKTYVITNNKHPIIFFRY